MIIELIIGLRAAVKIILQPQNISFNIFAPTDKKIRVPSSPGAFAHKTPAIFFAPTLAPKKRLYKYMLQYFSLHDKPS